MTHIFNPVDADSIRVTMLALRHNPRSFVGSLAAALLTPHFQALLLGADLSLLQIFLLALVGRRPDVVVDGAGRRFRFAVRFAVIPFGVNSDTWI